MVAAEEVVDSQEQEIKTVGKMVVLMVEVVEVLSLLLVLKERVDLQDHKQPLVLKLLLILQERDLLVDLLLKPLVVVLECRVRM